MIVGFFARELRLHRGMLLLCATNVCLLLFHEAVRWNRVAFVCTRRCCVRAPLAVALLHSMFVQPDVYADVGFVAVQSIQLFPGHGHLLLSGSADTKVKIWDVHNQRHCKRTYLGHTGGIKEVQFKCVRFTFCRPSW